ncbi:MAG: TolC family protein [Candidatus Eremiobacteraeota bacterium]|nr:TolC family protein [Candidatus Eremiobacteraeota bacterium]MBC5827878.1 TolC family protein [Candidatus Eremiobacteraeota bacterium]
MIFVATSAAALMLALPQGTPSVPLSFSGLSLSAAESQALLESPDVAVARARLAGADAVLRQQRGALGPAIVAGYTENPQAAPAGNSATISQHSSTVGLQTVLGNLIAYSPRVAAAAREYQAARSDELNAERVERIKLAGLYYAALKARATVNARDEALRLAMEEEQAAQKRFSAGDAPRVDVVRASVVVARATADAVNAKAASDNATDSLRIETGVGRAAFARTSSRADVGEVASAVDRSQRVAPAPTTPPGGAAATIASPSTGSSSFESNDAADEAAVEAAVQAALLQRPEVASASRGVAAAQASLNVARRATVPSLTLGAGYARGVDSGQKVSGPTVNAQLEFPLTAAASSGILASRAGLAEARARLAGAQRDVSVEVGSAVRNLRAASLAVAASTKARQQAQQELNATQLGYRNGASSSLERASAQATYADARLAELSAIYDEALARAVAALEIGR